MIRTEALQPAAHVITAKHTCPARHIALAYPGFPSICYSNPEFNLRCEFTRTINRVLPLGRSGEWLVWCRKETTRHGPGPARDRTAGWQPRSSAVSECGAATSGKNAPKPDRAALWRATDQLFRTGW